MIVCCCFLSMSVTGGGSRPFLDLCGPQWRQQWHCTPRSLIPCRVSMVAGAGAALAKAVTIATRYSAIRTQGVWSVVFWLLLVRRSTQRDARFRNESIAL